MVIAAAHVERVLALEPKHDPVLVVDANRVKPSQFAGQHVEPIPRGHSQLVEPGDGVELIRLALDDRPDGARCLRAALLLTPFQMSLVVSSASDRIM